MEYIYSLVWLLEQNCTYAVLPTAFNSFVSWQNIIRGILTNHIGRDGWIWKTNLGDLHFSLKYWFIWMRLNLKININIKRLCRQIRQVMGLILPNDLVISLMSNSHNCITINGNTSELFLQFTILLFLPSNSAKLLLVIISRAALLLFLTIEFLCHLSSDNSTKSLACISLKAFQNVTWHHQVRIFMTHAKKKTLK